MEQGQHQPPQAWPPPAPWPPPYGYGQFAAPPAAPPGRRLEPFRAPPAEHPAQVPWQLAGWWSRVGAQLLDLLIVWLPGSVLLLVPILLSDAARNGSGAERAWLIVTIVVSFLVLAAHYFYAPVLMRRKGRRNGQTLGKQACRIRVIRADGKAMRFSDAALRQIIYKSFGALVASTFVPIFPWFLNYLWPTWDEQHRALHDLAAQTRVVAA
jgi:uncharacterized RDD family membrane protein YckC